MPYLSIGQMEKLLSIPASTLRFWDTSVPFLTPARSRSGRRTYSLSEAALIARLKHLALERKLGLHRAQRMLEFELLYEDQDFRARAKALRDEMLLLMLRSESWCQEHIRFSSESKTSGEELFDASEH